MIFYLAALQSVPTNLKDAAKLEVPGRVRVFVACGAAPVAPNDNILSR